MIDDGRKRMIDDLVKRLTIKAGVMEMCETIEWGSDTSIMREAAARIEELEAKLAKAVGALREISSKSMGECGCYYTNRSNIGLARDTLEELKSQEDEENG